MCIMSEKQNDTQTQHKKEHSRDPSPVGHHMDFHQYKLDTDNINILDRESRWFPRGVREAI